MSGLRPPSLERRNVTLHALGGAEIVQVMDVGAKSRFFGEQMIDARHDPLLLLHATDRHRTCFTHGLDCMRMEVMVSI